MVFLNPRDWWKALDFCQNSPDQGSPKLGHCSSCANSILAIACWIRAPQGWGIAPLVQIPFLQLRVELSSEKKFPTQHVLVLVTIAIFWLDHSLGQPFAFP
jgi:hypothetical protein